MKKIITTVMLAVAAICSTAQAGDFYLGGAVGFMHKSGNEKYSYLFTGNRECKGFLCSYQQYDSRP